LFVVVSAGAGLWLRAQPPATRPAFELAAIRACRNGDAIGGSKSSPGRLSLGCIPLRTLSEAAYVEFASGHRDALSPLVVEGGPAWINRGQHAYGDATDQYSINAKAQDRTSQEMMLGPMMQTLLEDRFHLKIHRETREVAVYALTVGKGGTRLKRFDESCTPRNPTKMNAPLEPGQKPWCGGDLLFPRSGVGTVDFHGASMAVFVDRLNTSRQLGGGLDAPVVDKTGLTGLFDVHLELAPDEVSTGVGVGGAQSGSATAHADFGSSIITAVQQQLGLKLSRTRGPREFLVIDSVERPTEN
jgi:uncharacterized protein (TIGR03435 family)